MTSLIIYDSLYGNTQKVAEAVADTVKGKIVNVKNFKKEMLNGVTLLIVGSPIHGWQPSEETLAFLNALTPGSLKGIKIAAFDTRVRLFIHGDAAGKIQKQLVSLGGTTVVPPQAFIVEGKEGPLAAGETERARQWGQLILEKVK